jgi:repressor LexA
MATTLTARQLEVLNFVRKTLKASGLPPTRSEIAEALGFRSANAAEEHLRALARKGAIELLPGASRGIRLPDEPETNLSGLPVVGRVAAGYPILASEHIEEHLQLDPAAFHPRADYLLRVKGASMRDAGILNDDLLAVHAVSTAENGQIVVRPMNYFAMSYDHRIIDGREAVLGLVAIKEAMEDPSRLLFDI